MRQHSIADINDELVTEFNAIVGATKQMLQVLAKAGDDKASSLGAKLEHHLGLATDRLQTLTRAAQSRSYAAAQATDNYVHKNAWQVIGIAVGLSLLIGIASDLYRHRR